MNDSRVRSIALVAAFTALVCVGAIFSFPAPWNPVIPFTLATLFVILSGMMLGPGRGLAVVGVYLLLGIIGLPVFSGMRGGIQVLAGPSGGFLVGYALAAAAAGMIVKMAGRSWVSLIAAAVVATLVIYLPGLPWMHRQLMGKVDDWSWASTWGKYTLPFLVGDGVKAIAAVLITRYLGDRVSPGGKAD